MTMIQLSGTYKINNLSFCFASIGNFYTRDEKIKILELIYELFNNNYNKSFSYLIHFQEKYMEWRQHIFL